MNNELDTVLKSALTKLMCDVFDHKWIETDSTDHWHDNHKVLIRTRECQRCKKFQWYRPWRYWCFLNPWIDYK